MNVLIVLLQLSDFIEGLTQVTYNTCAPLCMHDLLYLWLDSYIPVYLIFFLAECEQTVALLFNITE